MKIDEKTKRLFEAKLFESDDDVIIDPSDSTAEMADDIASAIETETEGEVSVSDSSADKIAKEVKDVASDVELGSAVVDAGDDYLGVKNAVTEVLDMALAGALEDILDGESDGGHNVLIIGLPGSGKTASVYDWARANNVNLVSLNAKNNDLDAYINGYTTKDPDNPRRVTQAFSDNLKGLDKPRSVLFLDELNRQVKPQIRASLLTLINEHKIVGDGPNNQYTFKNLLFTIAAINPAVATDKGASPLNDAEMSRFLYTLEDMDSDPATTIEYLTKHYNKKINALDSSDTEHYRRRLEKYLRILDLGIFIMSHPRFSYNTKDDLKELAYSQKKLLCQRAMTQGLSGSRGNVDIFKIWVERTSNFLPKDKEMLLTILREYIKPSFEDLCKGHGVDPAIGMVDEGPATTASTEEPAEESGPDIEDDDDFFVSSSMAGKVRAKNPYEVELAIASALKDW